MLPTSLVSENFDYTVSTSFPKQTVSWKTQRRVNFHLHPAVIRCPYRGDGTRGLVGTQYFPYLPLSTRILPAPSSVVEAIGREVSRYFYLSKQERYLRDPTRESKPLPLPRSNKDPSWGSSRQSGRLLPDLAELSWYSGLPLQDQCQNKWAKKGG